MSVAVPNPEAVQIKRMRQLAGAIALAVLFDAIVIEVPFIAFLGIPFAVAAWRFRRGRLLSSIALTLWCALYTLLGVMYAVNNGFHDPAEAGRPTQWINPGDFVFVYVGTPLAIWLGALLVARIAGRRTMVAVRPGT